MKVSQNVDKLDLVCPYCEEYSRPTAEDFGDISFVDFVFKRKYVEVQCPACSGYFPIFSDCDEYDTKYYVGGHDACLECSNYNWRGACCNPEGSCDKVLISEECYRERK
jgi:hypothetical protein